MPSLKRRLTGRLIGPDFNGQMLQILRASPIESRALAVCFDRQPDIFAMARLKYDPVRYVGFFDADRLVGFAMLGFHIGHVGGRPTQVMHLSDYYVLEEFRGRGTFTEALKVLYREGRDRAKLGYAIVMEGNRAAERLMHRCLHVLSFLMNGRVIGTLEARTILVTFRRAHRSAIQVRPADASDLDAIVGLLRAEYEPRLFAPVIDREAFLRNLGGRPGCGIDAYYVAESRGRIVGVLAAWDTRAFKQNRVLRYGPSMQVTRIAYTFMRPVFGFPRLPKPTEAFRDVHITDCAAVDRSPEIVHALLERVYADCRRRGYNTIIFASAAQDPILEAARGFPSEVVRSHIVAFSTDPELVADGRIDTSMPYVDVALL